MHMFIDLLDIVFIMPIYFNVIYMYVKKIHVVGLQRLLLG